MKVTIRADRIKKLQTLVDESAFRISIFLGTHDSSGFHPYINFRHVDCLINRLSPLLEAQQSEESLDDVCDAGHIGEYRVHVGQVRSDNIRSVESLVYVGGDYSITIFPQSLGVRVDFLSPPQDLKTLVAPIKHMYGLFEDIFHPVDSISMLSAVQRFSDGNIGLPLIKSVDRPDKLSGYMVASHPRGEQCFMIIVPNEVYFSTQTTSYMCECVNSLELERGTMVWGFLTRERFVGCDVVYSCGRDVRKSVLSARLGHMAAIEAKYPFCTAVKYASALPETEDDLFYMPSRTHYTNTTPHAYVRKSLHLQIQPLEGSHRLYRLVMQDGDVFVGSEDYPFREEIPVSGPYREVASWAGAEVVELIWENDSLAPVGRSDRLKGMGVIEAMNVWDRMNYSLSLA
jgi:hypothetical protein